jgi:hypothetical protein
MSKALLGLTLVMGMLLVGCGTQPGQTMVKYNSDTTLPNLTTVGEDGSYALYSTWDTTPITTAALVKGDKLGFDKSADGGTVAVAGSNTYPIKVNWAKGSYYGNHRKK